VAGLLLRSHVSGRVDAVANQDGGQAGLDAALGGAPGDFHGDFVADALGNEFSINEFSSHEFSSGDYERIRVEIIQHRPAAFWRTNRPTRNQLFEGTFLELYT